MKPVFALLFLLQALQVWGQQTKVIDVGKENVNITSNQFYSVSGSPVSTLKYVKVVSGTPYFKESWMKGSIDLAAGNGYENLWLKIDLIDNSLLYLDAAGNEMVATSVIKQVTLVDSVTGKKFNFIHSSFINSANKTEAGWYQLIESGKATLYKLSVKITNEVKPYGSATYEQSIVTAAKYFLLTDSVLTQIKKFKALPGMLKNKEKELAQYINTKNLSGKTDDDYAALASFYNNLFEK